MLQAPDEAQEAATTNPSAYGFGGYSYAKTRRMMERFARQVVLHFAAKPTSVST
jgi:hypothetical protein